MNTRTTSRHGLVLSLLSLAMLSGGAFAQSNADSRSLDNPTLRTQSCGQVDIGWNLELIEQYPQISEACHEVVLKDGAKWARFEANFLRVNSDGSVTSEFITPRGQPLGRYTLQPGEGQQVKLDGRMVPFSALRANQRISLFVPEGADTLSSEPMVSTTYSRIVRYEPLTPDPTPAPMARTPQPESTRMADSSPPPQTMSRLPDTAGPLPWFATIGVISALAALALRRVGR